MQTYLEVEVALIRPWSISISGLGSRKSRHSASSRFRLAPDTLVTVMWNGDVTEKQDGD